MSAKLSSKESGLNLTLISEKNNISFEFIYTGLAETPVGKCFIAWTAPTKDHNLGNLELSKTYIICFLAFIANDDQLYAAKNDLQRLWTDKLYEENNFEAAFLVASIFNFEGCLTNLDISLLLKGTPFQEKIWHLLMQVPYGALLSYESLAKKAGGENFTRATANAIAKNNISYLIPCHRVISKSGSINKYRWGADIKKQLISLESNLEKFPISI